MKIIATKENLLSALRRANCAISSRIVVPAMNNVLLVASADRLTVTSTDSEIAIVTWVPALVEEEGSTTLPAKRLLQIITAMPNGDVTIESDADDVSTLTCMKSFYKIPGLAAVSYPEPQEIEYEWSFEMKVRDLVRGLIKVVYAKSSDETRKQLNGVVLSIKTGMLTVAATDGRRLALVENVLEDENAKDGDFILPSRASTELSRCIDAECEKVTIKLNKSAVSFETDNTILTTRLVEGIYPNFRQVIPENCGCTVAVPRIAFTEALNRVSLVVLDSAGAVKLTFANNQLNISASNAETGESSEPLEIAYDGEEVSVSFNPIFFIDPLKVMEADNINIEFGKQYTPVKLTGDEGFLYMLMPMRG